MKERITFIQPADGNFSPDQLEVGTHALRVKSLKAAREDRLKFSVEELPHEVRYIFLAAFNYGRGHTDYSIR